MRARLSLINWLSAAGAELQRHEAELDSAQRTVQQQGYATVQQFTRLRELHSQAVMRQHSTALMFCLERGLSEAQILDVILRADMLNRPPTELCSAAPPTLDAVYTDQLKAAICAARQEKEARAQQRQGNAAPLAASREAAKPPAARPRRRDRLRQLWRGLLVGETRLKRTH